MTTIVIVMMLPMSREHQVRKQFLSSFKMKNYWFYIYCVKLNGISILQRVRRDSSIAQMLDTNQKTFQVLK